MKSDNLKYSPETGRKAIREELDRINPQRKWNWRRLKKNIKKRGSRLHVGAYVLGYRGHPGVVTESNYWYNWSIQALMGADVSIKSLIDNVEENCSIFSCALVAISKEEAERRAFEIKTIHEFDLFVKYGYPIEKIKQGCQDWIDRGIRYYILHDQEGQVVRSGQAFTKEDAEKDIAHTEKGIKEGWYKGKITNPRMVEMLTYPAPIKSFEVRT